MKSITSRILVFVLALTGLISLAKAQEPTDVYRDNLMIVFDASGSMDDRIADANGRNIRKIEAAKEALKSVVRILPPSVNVGLFVFGNIRNDNPYPLGPQNQAKLFEAIDSANPGGGTPLGQYIKKAA